VVDNSIIITGIICLTIVLLSIINMIGKKIGIEKEDKEIRKRGFKPVGTSPKHKE